MGIIQCIYDISSSKNIELPKQKEKFKKKRETKDEIDDFPFSQYIKICQRSFMLK